MSEFKNIKGLDQLSKELHKIGAEVGKRAMRSAVNKAMTPTFKKVKMKAPVGSASHRVSRRSGQPGRLVGPGFLSRSIKKSSRFFPRKGRAIAKIKILPEAFYGAYYDVGVSGKFTASHWFTGTFISDRKEIEAIFQQVLRAYIKKFQ